MCGGFRVGWCGGRSGEKKDVEREKKVSEGVNGGGRVIGLS
jgi:hypothetical protein